MTEDLKTCTDAVVDGLPSNSGDVLQPCPFCGGEPLLEHIPAHSHGIAQFMGDAPDTFTVECVGCAAGFCGNNRDEVVAKWNARKQADVIGKAIARIDLLRDEWIGKTERFAREGCYDVAFKLKSELHGMNRAIKEIESIGL